MEQDTFTFPSLPTVSQSRDCLTHGKQRVLVRMPANPTSFATLWSAVLQPVVESVIDDPNSREDIKLILIEGVTNCVKYGGAASFMTGIWYDQAVGHLRVRFTSQQTRSKGIGQAAFLGRYVYPPSVERFGQRGLVLVKGLAAWNGFEFRPRAHHGRNYFNLTVPVSKF